jgi:hypothetical protein
LWKRAEPGFAGSAQFYDSLQQRRIQANFLDTELVSGRLVLPRLTFFGLF